MVFIAPLPYKQGERSLVRFECYGNLSAPYGDFWHMYPNVRIGLAIGH